MKILFNEKLDKIKKSYFKYKDEKVVMDSGNADKDKVIKYLQEELELLYGILGITKFDRK